MPDIAVVRAARVPSLVQLGRRLMLVIATVTLLALGIWLWAAWLQTRSAELERMNVTVKLLAAHADHYFTSLGRSLEQLAGELEDRKVLVRPTATLPALRHALISNSHLVSVALVRPDGQMLATTALADQGHRGKLTNVLANPEWRADFLRDLKAKGLSVDRPQRGYYLHEWFIHVRYPVRDQRGRVLFLIQAAIPLDRQQALWRDLGLRPDTNLGLVRDDGYFTSRIPNQTPAGEDIYVRSYRKAPLLAAIRAQPAGGMYEGAGLDGSDWLGVYRRLDTQPLYAFLAHKRSTFVALWWKQVRLPLSLALLFLVASGIAYGFVAARYGRRMRSVERQLADADGGGGLLSAGVHEIDALVGALAASREKLREAARNRERLLLAAAQAGTYIIREHDRVVLAADAAFLAMLGKGEAEVIGQSWSALVPGDEPGTDGELHGLARRVMRLPGGEKQVPRWIAVAEYRDTGAGGERIRHGLALDVSDRERLLMQLSQQSQRLQALWQLATGRDLAAEQKMRLMLRLALDAVGMEAVAVSELQGDRLVVRQLADDLRLFHAGQELPLDDTLCRRTVAEHATLVIRDLAADAEFRDHVMVAQLGLHGFVSVPIFEGSRFYGTMAFLRRAPLDDGFGTDARAFLELLAAWFGLMLVEEQQRAELERLAMTDSLTRLLNRRAAEQRLAAETARARRAGEPFAIAICDLDHFKLINDHYGHDVGDQVLVHIADLIRGALREGDWVARWGGEEFIIFLHQSDGPAAYTAMERLRHAVKERPAPTAHGALEITTSIGIGTWRESVELAAVLSEADGCLYEAKRAGRDTVVLSDTARRGTLWKAGMLQHALLESRVVPAYQVIVDLRTGEPVAEETLARLIEPEGRVVPAGEFVEAAEGINLIHIVDQTIARQALWRCLANVRGRGRRNLTQFINLSPQFLGRGELVQSLLAEADQICRQCRLEPGAPKPMVFEITERQLIGSFDQLARDLRPFIDAGFRLALDDFGSGYSSFLYLASLPISFLKIEGWMVRNLRDSARVLGMVRSIIALARDQGITTIAESVEDVRTAELLRELGAHWAQGYYYGRPECVHGAAPAADGTAGEAGQSQTR